MGAEKLSYRANFDGLKNALDEFYETATDISKSYDDGLKKFHERLSKLWYSEDAVDFYYYCLFGTVSFSRTMRRTFNAVLDGVVGVGTEYFSVLAKQDKTITFDDVYTRLEGQNLLEIDSCELKDENGETGMRKELVTIIKDDLFAMFDKVDPLLAGLQKIDFHLVDKHNKLKEGIESNLKTLYESISEYMSEERQKLNDYIETAIDNVNIGASIAEEILAEQALKLKMLQEATPVDITPPAVETALPEVSPTPTPDTTSHVVKHTDNQFGPFTTLY